MHPQQGILWLLIRTAVMFLVYPLLPTLVLGVPAIGVLIAQSALWNVIWWIVWIVWCLILIRDVPLTTLGIFAALVLFVIYIEVSPQGYLWSYGLAGAMFLLVTGTYIIGVIPGRRLARWRARTGTLGGTVRTMFRNYQRLRREVPSASEQEIAQMLLDHRFRLWRTKAESERGRASWLPADHSNLSLMFATQSQRSRLEYHQTWRVRC